MKRGLVAGIDYDKIQGPTIATFPGSKFAMLILSDVRPESRSYIAPLQDVLTGKAHWTQVTTFEDEVTDYDLHGDDLILLHNHGFSRGRLVKTSARHPISLPPPRSCRKATWSSNAPRAPKTACTSPSWMAASVVCGASATRVNSAISRCPSMAPSAAYSPRTTR